MYVWLVLPRILYAQYGTRVLAAFWFVILLHVIDEFNDLSPFFALS